MATIDTDELVANATAGKAKKTKARKAIPTTATEEPKAKKTKASGTKVIDLSLKDKIGQKFLAMFFWVRSRPRLFRRWVDRNEDVLKDILLAGLAVAFLIAQIVSAGMVGWFLAGWLLGLNGVGSFLLALGGYLLIAYAGAFNRMMGEEFASNKRAQGKHTFVGYGLL